MEQLSRLDRLATINEVKVLAMLQHPNVIEYYDNFIQVLTLIEIMHLKMLSLTDRDQNHE